MVMPFDSDNFAFEAHEFRNLSLTQRNKLVTSNENDNLYDKLLEAAFTGFATTTQNKTGKPLAVFCCIDSLSEACPLAHHHLRGET